VLSSTSNKKSRGAKKKKKQKTNKPKKKTDIYKQVNNLQTCKKEEAQEPKRERCRTPVRYEYWSSGAKTPRREKSNRFKGISKKRWHKGGEKTEKTGNESSRADNKRTV
jgi:hypothetical protein